MTTHHNIITTKNDQGDITEVETDMHIDELFKVVLHMRKGLDQLETLEKMGWPVVKNKGK